MWSEITKYIVTVEAGEYKKPVYASIQCFDVNNELIAKMYFHEEGRVLPDNSESNIVILRYPISKYSIVMDVLRNEKPVFINYYEHNRSGYIRTGSEPVGEGELHLEEEHLSAN